MEAESVKREGYGDPVWEELFRARSWGEYPSEEAVRFAKQARSWGLAGARALDIGAGQGACTWMLMREGFRVTAMEGSPAGAARIAEMVRSHGLPDAPEVLVGDILRPVRHLAGRTFDLLLDHYSLYANPKPAIAEAYREYARILRVGGFLLTCCFGKRTASYGMGREVGEDCFTDIPEGMPLGGRGCSTFFARSDIERLLEGSGFSVRYVEGQLHENARGRLEKIVVCAFPSGVNGPISAG